MLDKNALLSLMTKHFPRWMDIRKRVKTSNGGMYLQSLAYNTSLIQEAIEDYKKDFFLINYRDKYDDVPYYIYYINIGNIDTKNLTITYPSGLSEVSSVKDFYNTSNTYYYEDNKIFFKKENIDETSARVNYIYDDNNHNAIISKLYVWNIFDEFAAFVGLERFIDEDNKSLTNRILNVFKCIPNSSEDGLKNAIINDTINYINDNYPSMSFNEIRNKIIVERPTAENLKLKYNEFTTVLDKLAEINADVYRTKVWDEDIWQFALSGIDYIPHTWDYILAAYTNGIGFKDDLKPEFIEKPSDNNASAKVSVYKQDTSKIQEYLSGHTIDKAVKLRLLKYNENLQATNIKYTITASRPVDITQSMSKIKLRVRNNSASTQPIDISLSELIPIDTEYEQLFLNNVTQSFIKYHKEFIYEPDPEPEPDPDPDPGNPDPDKPNPGGETGGGSESGGGTESGGSGSESSEDSDSETDPTNPDQEETRTDTDDSGTTKDSGTEIYRDKVIKEIIITTSIERIDYDNPLIAAAIKKLNSSNIYFSIISDSDDLESVFVYNSNDTLCYDITNNHLNKFEYCYLTSKAETTYTSYNNLKTYVKKTDNVEIINNFSPIMQLDQQYIYVINDCTNCTATFNNDKYDKYIHSWSFGNSLINIVSDVNYTNVEYTEYIFDGVVKTNSPNILFSDIFTEDNIKKYLSYEDEQIIPSDFSIQNLCKYEIINNDTTSNSLTVNYSKNLQSQIDLSNDPNNINKYVRSVKVTNITSDYIKLPHVNIDTIFYIGSNMNWRLGEDTSGDFTDYKLHNDKGLITFNHVPNQDLYIVYTVKVPESLSIDINELYRLIEYNKQAYNKIYEHTIAGIYDGYIYDLSALNIEGFDDNCNIIVSDYSTYYIPAIINNTVLFNKAPENAIAIKYGYYYFGDQEYYLLANKNPSSEENITSVSFDNIRANGSEIILNRYNENYVKNSNMTLNTISNTYTIDFNKNSDVVISNKLGAISTCDNFYKWKTFGALLSLYPHNNNIGIRLNPYIPNGYAYIDITTDVYKDLTLSLYMVGNLKAYVIREAKIDNMKFRRSLSTEFIADVSTIHENDRYSCTYHQDEGYRYYLVISAPIIANNNLFDDIMLAENNTPASYNDKKNIDILGFNIKEQVTDNGFSNRIYFNSNKFGTRNNLDIDEDGYIINACNIDWDITKLFEYSNALDFENKLQIRSKVNINASGNYIYTLNQAGSITTEPFKLDNYKLIKSLIVEVNDIPFETMTGFQTRILVSETIDGTYEYIDKTGYTNIESFDGSELFGNYIKVNIIMPMNKIIGSIALYAEYKTTESEQPSGTIKSYGTITSSIMDSYYLTNYKINKINIDYKCPKNIFTIKIRSYKNNNIWTDWYDINFDEDGTITNEPYFENSRYFQAMLEVKDINAKIKINYIDIKRQG